MLDLDAIAQRGIQYGFAGLRLEYRPSGQWSAWGRITICGIFAYSSISLSRRPEARP